MIPELLAHLKDKDGKPIEIELLLALALCITNLNPVNGQVIKKGTKLPKTVIKQLWKLGLVSGSGRTRISRGYKIAPKNPSYGELCEFVNREEFSELRESWAKIFEQEQQDFRDSLNTPIAAANKANPSLHRDSLAAGGGTGYRVV